MVSVYEWFCACKCAEQHACAWLVLMVQKHHLLWANLSSFVTAQKFLGTSKQGLKFFYRIGFSPWKHFAESFQHISHLNTTYIYIYIYIYICIIVGNHMHAHACIRPDTMILVDRGRYIYLHASWHMDPPSVKHYSCGHNITILIYIKVVGHLCDCMSKITRI